VNYNSYKVFDTGGTAVVEPLSVLEFKNYARLEGFVDDGDSQADSLSDFDFDFDDGLIAQLITDCRLRLENYTNVSFIPKTLKALLTNLCGRIAIPAGPVNTITKLSDSSGTEILAANYTIVGFLGDFPVLKDPMYSDMVLEYTAGYSTLPKNMKLDLLRLVLFSYINRGDEEKIQSYVSTLGGSYTRKTFLA
jgi:hypothetical protein